MTTICMSHPKRDGEPFKVWGNHDGGPHDRFVFDVREFTDLAEAEAHAKRMMTYHEADHFERIVRT